LTEGNQTILELLDLGSHGSRDSTLEGFLALGGRAKISELLVQ